MSIAAPPQPSCSKAHQLTHFHYERGFFHKIRYGLCNSELEFIQGHPMTVFSEISEFLYLEEGQEFLYDGSSCVKFLAKIQTHLSQLDDKYRLVIASVQRKLKIKSVSQEKDYNALLGYCLRCSKSPIQFTVMTLLYGTLQDTYSSDNLCPLMYCAPVISRKTIDCISA